MELFHLLGAAPSHSYDITINSNYSDFENTSKSAHEQLTHIQSELTQGVGLNDEEKVAIDNITEYYTDFQNLAAQVLTLSSQGKKEEAFTLLGDRIDGLVGEYLRPEIDKLEVIKEDDVKTSLPALTSTLTSHGVIPIPGLQNQINHVIIHFENSVDTQKIGKLVDDLQAEVFYQVAKEESIHYLPSDDVNSDAQTQEIEDQVSSTITHLREGLSQKDDQDELTLIAQVEEGYTKLVTLNNQAVALGKSGHSPEALTLLRGSIDVFAEGTLDPLTKKLIASDQQDVKNLTNTLSGHLNTITYSLYTLGVLVFLLGIGGLWKLSRDIITPIIKLRNATARLATGDFNTRVPVTSKDEIGELAQAFNSMGEKLSDLYRNLEEKVKGQTSELSKRISELESTKKATLNLLEDLNQEKEKVEGERAKDEAIIGSIGDGLVVCDTEGNMILVNSSFEKILGMEAKNVIGKKLTDVLVMTFEDGKVMPRDRRPMVRTLEGNLNEITATGKSPYYTRQDGNRFPVSVTVTPITVSGKLTGAVEVFRDITEERRIDKAKSEFVSLASHQLRTPLTAIRWYSGMLKSGDGGKITPEQKEFVDQIYDSNKRMVELVNSLLNVSRIDLGTLASDPKPTDIVALIESVVGELAPQIRDKNLEFKKLYANKILTLSVDPKLIRMVVQNLLSNAIKYTPPKGTVSVSLSSNTKEMEFSVTDTGYGIPENQKNKIFTKLFRADNAIEKEADGNGLGLYIVKSIAETNDGKVWFESEENKGTTFHFTLPMTGMKKTEGSRTLS